MTRQEFENHECIMYDAGVIRFRFMEGLDYSVIKCLVQYWLIKLQTKFKTVQAVYTNEGVHVFYSSRDSIDIVC